MAAKFEPKTPVQLAPPKDDPISPEALAKCNGIYPTTPHQLGLEGQLLILDLGIDSDKTYVAIKGTVFDVTGNKSYAPGASYHGTSSLLLSYRPPNSPSSYPIYHC